MADSNRNSKINLLKNFGNSISKRNQAIRESELAYYETTKPEKIKSGYELKSWEKKAFDGDYDLFNDSSLDQIMDEAVNTNLTDSKYDWALQQRLLAAQTPVHNGEYGEEETNMLRAGESQLNRQIIQDCIYSDGQIRIIQQTPVGTCSIPSMYQIDKIAIFAGMTLKEAQVISKIYRILEIGFKEALRLNKFIKARQPGVKPWDVIVNKQGMSLLKLAQELKALALTPQEDPEWAHIEQNSYCTRVLDDQAADYDSDFDCKSYDQYRSEQWEPTNQVGEFTYWKLSNIPKADHLAGKNSKQFRLDLSKLEAGELTREQIQAINKKAFTPAQKAIWNKTVKRIANQRAEFKVAHKTRKAA